jgi:peptidoglycan-associated lipoprotein
MKNLLSLVAATLILTACASTSNKPAAIIQEGASSSANGAQTKGLTQAEIETQKLTEQLQELKSQSVYFDFDSSAIKPEYKKIINNQADFVKSHRTDIVTLEGNCDERGSSEYNLALGDKRANIVRKELELLGVPASQIKTVSFGEEKPRLTCHEERCWKENRRVDFDHKQSS